MTTIHLLSIPADTAEPMRLVEIDRDDFRGMQSLVGGLIQPMYLREPSDSALVVNEEGKLFDLEFNVRATDIAREYSGLMHPLGDYVAGDAYVCGPVDVEGNTTSVPTESAIFQFCQVMATNVGDSPDFDVVAIAEVAR